MIKKHIIKVFIILIIIIFLFEIEKNLYRINYTFKKSKIINYNLSKNYKTNITTPIIFRPINNNSNWASLILNEEDRTIYFHSIDVNEEVINFCKTRKCIEQNNLNMYPIKLSQMLSVFCGVEGEFWKIDDDILYNSEWLKFLEKENNENEKCLIIGNKAGGKIYGTLTNEYYFPYGHIYFLNNVSKNILCNNSKKIIDDPEDMAIGQILSLQCKEIIFIDIKDQYGHKILNLNGKNIIVDKKLNH